MGDTLDRTDDAPATTAKDRTVRDEASEALIESQRASEVIGKTITINRDRHELYAFWRDFSNLAEIMENVERIEVIDDRRSHWVVSAPGGQTVEWDSIVTEDQPGSLIAWTSAEHAEVRNSGRIAFRDAPGGRGTWVNAVIAYDPPAGIIGKLVAKLFQREPAIQARRDLRRFKQLMEAREIATSARTQGELETGKE